jgi:hypothetical protein
MVHDLFFDHIFSACNSSRTVQQTLFDIIPESFEVNRQCSKLPHSIKSWGNSEQMFKITPIIFFSLEYSSSQSVHSAFMGYISQQSVLCLEFRLENFKTGIAKSFHYQSEG